MTGGERLTEVHRRLVNRLNPKIAEVAAGAPHLSVEEAARVSAKLILAALAELGDDPELAHRAVDEALAR